MKVLADYWFSDMYGGHCGIVVGEDEITEERKAYIGTADGISQESDRLRILSGGQKLSPALLAGLLRLLGPEEKGKGVTK